MSQAVEQLQTAQTAMEQVPDTSQSSPDVSRAFADDFTEEMIGQLLEQEKPADAGEPAHGEEFQEEAQKTAEQTKDEQKPDEQKPDEDDGKYLIPMFGKDVELEGDQLVELAEAGAQFIRHRDEVQQAMQIAQQVAPLIEALRDDPAFLAHMRSYKQGTPEAQAVSGSPEDAVEKFKAQLRQELIAEIEQRYKPFVENVNNFAAEQLRDKAFSAYSADPEYAAVNSLMTRNITEKVAQGHITHEQAAYIDKMLKQDAKLYGEWFPKFKAALSVRQQENSQAMPPAMGKTVHRAPRLEGKGGVPEMANESIKQRWDGGDRAGAFAATLMQTLK